MMPLVASQLTNMTMRIRMIAAATATSSSATNRSQYRRSY